MKTIFGFLLVLFSACSALADSTVYVIAKAQSEIDGIDAQISTERAKSARARAVLAARAKDFNAIKTRHDTLQRQYAIDADAYNRNCAGRPVSYGSCPSWRAKVLAEQQQLTPLLADMERRANELSRQGQQLSNEQVFSDARVQKLTNYKSQLQVSVQNLKATIAQQCAGITASSSIADMNQQCGNLQFAGTQSDLPKCTTKECSKFKLPAPPPQAANTLKCEGTFCTKDNPKNAGGAVIPPGQKQTTYDSASAQAAAAAKEKENSGCVFDGRAGCKPADSLTFPQARSPDRGSASLPAAVKEAMSKTPEGQKLITEETALRGQFAGADAKLAEIKAKRDAATDNATRGQLAVDYVKADKIKTDIGQQLYVKEIAVETEAKKYVLDK